MRNICIIIGSRAEYGLLRSVMQEIQAAKILQLPILASGNFELGTLPQAVSLNFEP